MDEEPTIQDDIRSVCKLTAIEYFSTANNLVKPLFLQREEIIEYVVKTIKDNYDYSLPYYTFSDTIINIMIEECQNCGVNLKIMKDGK